MMGAGTAGQAAGQALLTRRMLDAARREAWRQGAASPTPA